MGGKRQANILASVITNFETVEDVIETSMNSSGSAMAENAKWMDSIAGKSEQLSNNMQAMWNNTLNSDMIKWFYDLAIGATNLVKEMGLLPPALAAVLIYLKAFKNIGPISLGKDFVANSKSFMTAVQQVQQMSHLGFNKMTNASGMLDAQAVKAYANAIAGYSAEQQAAILTTNGLSKAQAAQILAQNGVEDAIIKETLGQKALNAAKIESTVLTGNEIKTKLIEKGLSEESVVAKWLEAHATEQLTRDKILAAIASGAFKGATDQEIASLLGLVGATNSASFSIKGLTSAMWAMFASNPLGWLLTAVTLIPMVVSWIGSLKKSNDELIQQADELKNAYKQESDTIQGNISTLQGLEEEFNKLSRGVDDYGNNISLATDDYERYREIVSEIVGISPSLIEGYDAEGKALVNKNSLLERSIELMQQEQRIKAQELVSDENLEKLAKGNKAKEDEYKKENPLPYGNAKWDFQTSFANAISEYKNKHAKETSDQFGDYDLYSELNFDGWQSEWNNLGGGYVNHPGNFAQDYYEQLVEDLRSEESVLRKYFTEEQIQNLLKYANEYDKNVEVYNTKIKDINRELYDVLQSVPASTTAYYGLDDQMQGYISNYINNLEDVATDNLEKKKQEIEDLVNFIANNSDVQGIISTGSNLKTGKDDDGNILNYKKYKEEINNLINDINNSDYTEAQKTSIVKLLGLDTESKEFGNEIEKAALHAKNLLQDEFDGDVDNLSISDILITTRITEDPNGLTFAELKQKIQEIKDSSGINITPVKTYSTLLEDIEKYNEVQAQTSEVIANDTEVSQEYKDALTELGISAKDLKDCFYENNPLVVKNADALNELVKDTKKVTVQNIKLAKSQARLEYYEKFKELKKLTNGKKVETAATLNQVKAIYLEMNALQKSISRYSMLEHQLLGATNAYEEFEKAQEIDEANDYETKAENLVGYLVDAFQTAKLGTESAQAAIKGLVPESVYSDLDTLDDKMAAVYKYFTTDLSKYFYVKFNDDGSLESAEMLVDNVKKFVEDGISKGVFTGSWEEWDLDSSISTLEDLTKKMGVTKEVAYAFLQAMETYDISWIGGDASTLLDKLIPTTSQINTVKEQIQDAFNQTPFDLTARLNVSAEKLEEQGHTSYSSTFDSSEFGLYNEDGSSYQILATPVLPNGDILSADEMANYINQQLASGKSIKEVDIFVGSYKIKEEAEEAKKILDESIKHYQNLIKNYNLENAISTNTQKQAELQYKLGTGQIDADTVVSADGKTTAAEQLKQLEAEADANTQAARENITAWSEAKKKYDEASETVSELNKKISETDDDRALESYTKDLAKAEKKMWDTYEALAKIGEPREVVLTVALEQVEKDLEEAKKKLNETELSIVSKIDVANLEKGKDGKWIVDIDAYSNLDEESKAKVQKYIDYLAEQHNINILQGEGAVTTLDVLTEIKEILSKTYDLMVNTDDAQTKAQSFADVWNSIKDKVVTLTQNIKEGVVSFFTRTPKDEDGGTVGVNGTAHVGGTAFAGGSWGAPKTETALTGELGPEILVRNGKWTTVGENGAEFTQVKKGDIIFNHKQSEQLLKNGYITGRGKAYVGGTAYAGQIHPWLGGMGNIDDDWKNITPTLWNTATNGEYLADAMKDAADSVNEFEETIDWIEIRMEELDESLNLLSAHLENASSYSDKNNIIENIIDVNSQIYKNAEAGAKYYQEYANKYLEGMSKELADAAKDGSIAITEFTKESDEATVKAIQNYRDFTQKAADLTQQAVETIATIREFYIQKIDNAEHMGSVRATVEDSQTEKLQNAVDFDEARGLITDPNYYAAMMENSKVKMGWLTKSRDEMQAAFDQAVKDGQLIPWTDQWYEELDKLYQIDAEIDEATAELEEFQNAINDIYWENFDELVSRLDYISEETQGLIDLMSELDMVSKPDSENGWGANDVEWTKEGLATLGLHAQEMERAEAKAKLYAVAIDDLNKEYKAGHYSESEYHEKLNELTQGQYDAIKAAQEEKEAIVELNEARVDAIKEGIEKEVDAYEKLIDAKKKELDVEKDLYDFQKRASEQSKNIADIERKLAALANDNSMSAIAKRRQLEAELAEAKQEQEELYYERSIENQQNALDAELEDFQKEKEAEIEEWDKYLENVETLVTESLGIVQANATEIGATLTEKTQEYNLTVSDAVLNPWKDGVLAIDDYTTKFGDAASSTTAQLSSIRYAWQQVKEEIQAANQEADKYYKAGTADGPSVAEINKENADYIQAKKTPTPAANNNNNKSNNSNKTKAAPSVGGTVTVKTSATKFGSKSGNAWMASFVPGGSYTVYEVENGQALIGRNGVYTGWVNITDLHYSKGTKGVKEDQLAWIDENGLEELVMHAGPDGRLQYLSKGTSVLNSELTNRIMDLAMNPQEVLDRNRPQIAPSKSIVNNEISINMNIAEVVHIDEVTNDTLPDLTKVVEKQMDSYMTKLNNSLKRYTR